ncbi:MAG: helix-turn-helix transcriptional regulator [Lachnospiraceae bacterium]|nr:helix-turn-helix transcriptional regulator [Lachnospiraceae bacterium]
MLPSFFIFRIPVYHKTDRISRRTIFHYILRIRISFALEFLQNGTLSIGEISSACGFCDIYHFSKCFKSIVGITPSVYRNK